MKRPRILSVALVIACLSLVAVGCVAPAAPMDSGGEMMAEDEMPLSGSTLRVGSIGDALPALGTQHERLDPAFVEATGVDLQADFPPFTDYVAKVTTMCQSGSDLYDVMWLDGPWYGLFVSQGCLEDLSDYIANDSGEVSLDDYPLRSLAVLGTYNETFYVIPQFAAVGMLAYRMDLFNDPDEQAAFKEEYGYDLQVPETWGQYLDVGTFFTRPDEGLWGFNHRYGNPSTLMGDLLIGFAFSRGASLFDGDWNPTFNTPEMQDALGFFTSEEFLAAQPPGKEGYFTDDVMLNAMQGKVAMYITENWAISNLMDPTRSPMAENLGWALIPGWEDPETGEIHRGTMAGAGGWAINANSENKEAAWAYIQFMQGRTNAKILAEEQQWCYRISDCSNADYASMYPYFPINLGQMEIMVPRPSEAWWPEAEFAFASNVGKFMAGEMTLEEALAAAQAQAEQIVADAGYAGVFKNYTPDEKEAQACTELASLGVQHPDCN